MAYVYKYWNLTHFSIWWYPRNYLQVYNYIIKQLWPITIQSLHYNFTFTWVVQQLLSPVLVKYFYCDCLCGISKSNVLFTYMLNFRIVAAMLEYFWWEARSFEGLFLKVFFLRGARCNVKSWFGTYGDRLLKVDKVWLYKYDLEFKWYYYLFSTDLYVTLSCKLAFRLRPLLPYHPSLYKYANIATTVQKLSI